MLLSLFPKRHIVLAPQLHSHEHPEACLPELNVTPQTWSPVILQTTQMLHPWPDPSLTFLGVHSLNKHILSTGYHKLLYEWEMEQSRKECVCVRGQRV